ncbi:hypothetical protein HDU84_006597, partial [Entophlyctis sp. JEL0112]
MSAKIAPFSMAYAAGKLNRGEADIAINWAGGLHHAKRNEASGFCYVNDIVLAILELLRVHDRVVYIDIDVHHGDGVEEAFYLTDRVMTVSFHRFGEYFPGTGGIDDIGIGAGRKYSVNVPLKDGIDDESYKNVFCPIMEAVMHSYRPSVVVLQCGADSLSGDRLGCFNLSMKGHAHALEFMKKFNLPILLLGGGGYTVRNVSRTWTYETAVALGVSISQDLPFNDYYHYYGPDYKLDVVSSNMENLNSKESLEMTLVRILENIRSINHAPSVQMQEVPRDEVDEGETMDEDSERHKDVRMSDANYTVSSYKDHIKALQRSQTHDVIINPVFENMFSALRHFPRARHALRAHALPSTGPAAADEGVGGGAGAGAAPAAGSAQVTGMNRFKYFRRPVVPYQPSLGAAVVYARKPTGAPTATSGTAAGDTGGVGGVDTAGTSETPVARSVAVQTVFRESEAQTDPYSPEYTLQPGQAPPELLALATLSYGMGLPAGMVELEMIERARVKRAWEAMLPQVVDKETFERRLAMMEEMELKEWQEREDEIRRLQEARLEILTKVISKREKKNEEINNERVERIWQKKLQEREAMLDKIESKRVKAMRKLAEKRSKIGTGFERRDIIGEYANYGSRVYAPKARDGMVLENAAEAMNLEIKGLEDYATLATLESAIDANAGAKKIALPKRDARKLNPTARKEANLQEQLRIMAEKLKQRHGASDAMAKSLADSDDSVPLRFQIRNARPPVRPPTPKISEPSPLDEELDVSAIMLQKLIRGRISQNLMYQGKQRRLQLINELRTRHTIRRALGARAAADEVGADGGSGGGARHALTESSGRGTTGVAGSKDSLTDDHQFVEGEEWNPEVDDINSPEWLEKLFESSVQAEYVGKTLDFLSKELVRLREERRISAMVRLAERTRQLREAAETETRAAELIRRKEEDEVFRKMMRVTQETVDSYLEDIVFSGIDSTAGLQAKEQVKQYAEKIATMMQGLEKRESDSDDKPDNFSENVVADLVTSFLVPEVERECVRNQSRFPEFFSKVTNCVWV